MSETHDNLDVNEIRYWLRRPPHLVSTDTVRAVCKIIEEDPNAFWRDVSEKYADHPDGRNRCIMDLVEQVQGQNIGRGRW